ncbi:MAG TPA: hypothetical protein VE641_14955 [Chthoniobacterales bacterium]|nr:hypothetical protein [Chthoniobacterales bacterium]
MNIQNKLTQLPNLNGNTPQFCKNILAPIDLRKEATVDLGSAIALADPYDADLWLLGFSGEPAIANDTRAFAILSGTVGTGGHRFGFGTGMNRRT